MCAFVVILLLAEVIFLIFYIDVYFLINFTVDILSLSFASSLSKVTSSLVRIMLLSLVGSGLALANALIFGGLLSEIGLSLLYFLLIFVFAAKNASFYRRMKLTAVFIVLEALMGGLVSFGYSFLDRHLGNGLFSESDDLPNRRLLSLALLILLASGVFRLLVLFFTHTATQKNVTVKISLLGKETAVEALVDTGNLLTEPVSERPVMLLKLSYARKIYDKFPGDTSEIGNVDKAILKRIAVIPAYSIGGKGLLVGIRADGVKISDASGGSEQAIDVIIAADKEGGTYGGFGALIPAAVLDGVL